MSERSLPWYVKAPDPPVNRHGIFDAENRLVAECYGDEDDGCTEAIAICSVVNRAGEPICAHCGEPATCFGSYEDSFHPSYACDECCGHGCEDGHCEPVATRDEGAT